MDTNILERIERAIREDGRYAPEAFNFLQEGLDLAARLKYGPQPGKPRRHVTGQELCEALRSLALKNWGPLAGEVLRRWNIRRTRDFGEMVYLMINVGVMGRQESDDIGDFDDVYDFGSAFSTYQIPLDAEDEQGPTG
jgi:uncharacterized repeat protein (TIGR04138 family)